MSAALFDLFLDALVETAAMVGLSGAIAFLAGIPLAGGSPAVSMVVPLTAVVELKPGSM